MKRLHYILLSHSILNSTTLVNKSVTRNDKIELAQEYYTDTINSILEAPTYGILISILNEFSDECLLDHDLKLVSYRSKELLLILQYIYFYITIDHNYTINYVSNINLFKNNNYVEYNYHNQNQNNIISNDQNNHNHKQPSVRRSRSYDHLLDIDIETDPSIQPSQQYLHFRSSNSNTSVSLRMTSEEERQMKLHGIVLRRLVVVQAVLKVK